MQALVCVVHMYHHFFGTRVHVYCGMYVLYIWTGMVYVRTYVRTHVRTAVAISPYAHNTCLIMKDSASPRALTRFQAIAGLVPTANTQPLHNMQSSEPAAHTVAPFDNSSRTSPQNKRQPKRVPPVAIITATTTTITAVPPASAYEHYLSPATMPKSRKVSTRKSAGPCLTDGRKETPYADDPMPQLVENLKNDTAWWRACEKLHREREFVELLREKNQVWRLRPEIGDKWEKRVCGLALSARKLGILLPAERPGEEPQIDKDATKYYRSGLKVSCGFR
jgi:hypothetical protein